MEKDGGEKQRIDPLFKDLAGGDPETDPTLLKIKDLHEKGLSLRQIAGEIGKSKEYVRLKLKEMFPDSEKPPTRPRDVTPILLFDDETIGFMVSYPFTYFANRYGDFWKLSVDEQKELARLVNKVSSKWAPRFLINWSDELALGQVAFMMIYPRYLQTKDLILKEKTKVEPIKTDPKIE